MCNYPYSAHVYLSYLRGGVLVLSLDYRVDYNGWSSVKFRAKLTKGEQFDERADIVAGLPGLKGAIKGGRGQCV